MNGPTRSLEVLEVLHRHHVEFIVVGMTAGVLQGTPAITFDLDILYSRASDNIARLLDALREMSAFFRTDPDRRIEPNLSHLASAGHKLLATNLGQLDVLGELGAGEDYECLLPDTIVVDVAGTPIRVLGLERLIAAKQAANRDKDRAVLPLLRATLERSRKR